MNGGRCHIILVPGFGGFDALGAIDYYEGVVPILRAARPDAALHFFPNLPTASVVTRAKALGVWLGKRLDRGVIGADDELAFVAHSTGGLDVRQLFEQLRGPGPIGPSVQVRGKAILDKVRSIQYLSVPHRGTNLASWFRHGPCLLGALARVLFEGLRFERPQLASWLAQLGRLFHPAPSIPTWVDAVIDTVRDFGDARTRYDEAVAYRSYQETLRWLHNMARDDGAISDLCPLRCSCEKTDQTPARWPDRLIDQELDWYARPGRPVEVRSYVTCCRPILGREGGIATPLHRLVATCPEASLAPPPPHKVKTLDGREVTLRRADNDVIVNSLSMIWPDVDSTVLVEADHGDIIGHFARQAVSGGDYDVLRTTAPFNGVDFETIWRAIAAFA